MARHRVVVSGVPGWLDVERLLGPGRWTREPGPAGEARFGADLDTAEAADVAERLRGVGIGGRVQQVEVDPPLSRPAVRRARTIEARRRRARGAGFSRRGARVDAEGRRSLTPEQLALELGRRAAGRSVLDACCGCGGNAIGFARAGSSVIAVERDPERVDMARHNARLYGVADRIRFVCGDACDVVRERDAELLFVDPPWGAGYDRRRTDLGDLPLLAALLPLGSRFGAFWAKVPPSFDVATLPGCEPSAVFGEGEGDHRRVKFLLLVLGDA